MSLEQIRSFIIDKGYAFEPETLDGGFKRAWCALKNKKIWYVGHEGLRFCFGEYDSTARFRLDLKKALTPSDKLLKKEFDEALRAKNLHVQMVAKDLSKQKWEMWAQEHGDKGLNSPYLERKKLPVRRHEVLVIPSENDAQRILVVPMTDAQGEVWNLQQIYTSGDKPFSRGARVKGLFHVIGDELAGPYLIGEGYATCLAAHLATGLTTYCAFSLSNLEPVLRVLLEQGKSEIVLLADFDGATFKKRGENPGMLNAQKLASKYKVRVLVPPLGNFSMDQNFDFSDVWQAGEEIHFEPVEYAEIQGLVFKIEKETPPPPKLEIVRDEPEVVENSGEFEMGIEGDGATVGVEPEEPVLKIERVGETWVPKKFEIETRNSGFHKIIPKNEKEVKYVPQYRDLRKFFEEKHPFVTHVESEVVYAWNGKIYEIVPEIVMRGFAEEHFDPPPTLGKKSEFKDCVICYKLRRTEFFTCDKKINFNNGYLDLEKLEFRPHTPELGFKHSLAYDFDENAKCPQFDAFLLRIFEGDELLVQMVLEYLGYILSGDSCWLQKAMVLKGEGSNGKSTFLSVVRALIGENNIVSAKLDEFKSEYTRQRLDGKLANISEETPKEAMLDSSVFKDIVAGGTMQVRAIYGAPYDLKVRAKLLFSCNDMPASSDSSHALFRRLLIVPFNVLFSDKEADPFMDQKLIAELPGIFNKVLQAYQVLDKRRHMILPDTTKQAVAEYKMSSSVTARWLSECARVVEPASEDYKKMSFVSEMYFAFAAWSDARGFKRITLEKFSRDLKRSVSHPKTRFVRERPISGTNPQSAAHGVMRPDGVAWSPKF